MRRRAAVAGAVALVVAGLLLVGVAVVQQRHRDAEVAAQAAHLAQVDHRAASEALGATPVAAGGEPSGRISSIGASGAILVIPALGVRAPIVATGAVDGSMAIPPNIHTVGWYDGVDTTASGAPGALSPKAPFPGHDGVALVAGHVDWAGQGPGALYYLGQLTKGDPIDVVGSNGVVTDWRVSQAPITISKHALPADLFAVTGPPRLAVVTCGGPFDAATGHYLDNVIVWASPAS